MVSLGILWMKMETKVTTKREGKGRKRLYVPQDWFGQETAD